MCAKGSLAFLGGPRKPANGRGQIAAGPGVLPDRNTVIPGRARLVATGERISAQGLRTVSDRGTDLAGRLRTRADRGGSRHRSEEHTSELQSLMRISYAVFCLKKTNSKTTQ